MDEEMEDLEVPDWALNFGFDDIPGLEVDEEKCFYETEENEEVVQLVYYGDKPTIVKTTLAFAEKFKNTYRYFYIGGNLESKFFPRGIFQKGPYNITVNGVGKYFIVTLVKSA